jgi:hypothetical protein
MTSESMPKLPGWTRRPAELTLAFNLRPPGPPAAGQDSSVFFDPANAVAYRMIGGAYGVLGVEVLGYYVPRALDPERWGIYVREAGVAWLGSQCGTLMDLEDGRQRDVVVGLSSSIAAHHRVHFAVEQAVTDAHGRDAYLRILRAHSPRHPPAEEALADAMFRAEMPPELGEFMSPSLDGEIVDLVAAVDEDLHLTLDRAALDPLYQGSGVPHYLVLEPHLPEATGRQVREALLAG